MSGHAKFAIQSQKGCRAKAKFSDYDRGIIHYIYLKCLFCHGGHKNDRSTAWQWKSEICSHLKKEGCYAMMTSPFNFL